MGIDSPDRCYFKAMLGYDKLQNDICLSTASMSESDFAPKSKITKQFDHNNTALRQQQDST